jgi:hypothetical protein
MSLYKDLTMIKWALLHLLITDEEEIETQSNLLKDKMVELGFSLDSKTAFPTKH